MINAEPNDKLPYGCSGWIDRQTISPSSPCVFQPSCSQSAWLSRRYICHTGTWRIAKGTDLSLILQAQVQPPHPVPGNCQMLRRRNSGLKGPLRCGVPPSTMSSFAADPGDWVFPCSLSLIWAWAGGEGPTAPDSRPCCPTSVRVLMNTHLIGIRNSPEHPFNWRN